MFDTCNSNSVQYSTNWKLHWSPRTTQEDEGLSLSCKVQLQLIKWGEKGPGASSSLDHTLVIHSGFFVLRWSVLPWKLRFSRFQLTWQKRSLACLSKMVGWGRRAGQTSKSSHCASCHQVNTSTIPSIGCMRTCMKVVPAKIGFMFHGYSMPIHWPRWNLFF